MASQLAQKLAAFRSNQMKLQTKSVEEAKRKATQAERQKAQRAAKPKAKPGKRCSGFFLLARWSRQANSGKAQRTANTQANLTYCDGPFALLKPRVACMHRRKAQHT